MVKAYQSHDEPKGAKPKIQGKNQRITKLTKMKKAYNKS